MQQRHKVTREAIEQQKERKTTDIYVQHVTTLPEHSLKEN